MSARLTRGVAHQQHALGQRDPGVIAELRARIAALMHIVTELRAVQQVPVDVEEMDVEENLRESSALQRRLRGLRLPVPRWRGLAAEW